MLAFCQNLRQCPRQQNGNANVRDEEANVNILDKPLSPIPMQAHPAEETDIEVKVWTS